MEVEWEYSQQEWRRNAKGAAEIARKKRKAIRRKSLKWKRERRKERTRQKQAAITARIKAGFVVVGENFDPSACDGSCPF